MNLADMRRLVTAIVEGTLVEPPLQRERLDTISTQGFFAKLEPVNITYGLGIMKMGSYLGHAGDVPGFTSIMMRDPKTKTTITAMFSEDVGAILFFAWIAAIVTPKRVPWTEDEIKAKVGLPPRVPR